MLDDSNLKKTLCLLIILESNSKAFIKHQKNQNSEIHKMLVLDINIRHENLYIPFRPDLIV